MARYVDQGDVPGIVTLVARRGEVAVDAVGSASVGGRPVRRNTIFRISSMTKPVTAVAAMLLVEEGILHLDDAVDELDRKSTRLNSSHMSISYAVFCLKK